MKTDKATMLLVAVLTLSAAAVASVPVQPDASRVQAQRIFAERAAGILNYLGVSQKGGESRLVFSTPGAVKRDVQPSSNRVMPLDVIVDGQSLCRLFAPTCFVTVGIERRMPMGVQRRHDIRRAMSPPAMPMA